MNLSKLQISGDLHADSKTLEKFSKDASSYRIMPALVTEPKSEDDILKIVQFAKNEGLSITSRAGGSGLSGVGVGTGIILNFKKYFNRVLSVGEETVVQPGTILDDFLQQMQKMNLMIPSVPSSSALCALGGNVGTRSTGPRTARYGTIDDFITSLKFITAKGKIVDTRNPLPDYLYQGLTKIRNQFLLDKISHEIVARRPSIAGGYNLKALMKYSDTRELAAHLIVSSVGTLAIVTEIRLKLMENKTSQGTFVAHFRDWDEFAEAANRLKALNPSALKFSDASCSSHVNGKILNYSDPTIAVTLIVEFDESNDQAQQGKAIIESCDISQLWDIPPGSADEATMWEDHRRILPSLWKYARENKKLLPSIIDDVAIHLKDFGTVRKEISDLMKKLGLEISFFGHLGFGSVHARPYFNPGKGDLIEQILTVSQKTFKIFQKYHGTLVGEHNAGRSRSIYLEQELGSAFQYTKMIKDLFDPGDILNPGTVFNTEPIYVNMDFDN
jgi:glycolate oxidase